MRTIHQELTLKDASALERALPAIRKVLLHAELNAVDAITGATVSGYSAEGSANIAEHAAQLRGCRNQAHSNYATDYFKMDGQGSDGLVVTGKSADYMGVEGKIRYRAQLKAILEGGTVNVDDINLIIKDADAVTLCFVAATNFVSYKDVSADQDTRVENYLKGIEAKSFDTMRNAAVKDYQRYFNRVSLKLELNENSFLPTDKRIARIVDDAESQEIRSQRLSGVFMNHANHDVPGTSTGSELDPGRMEENRVKDPSMASLCYNFGRYLLISSSRPGTEPANVQGIWNEDMNPKWDSKYCSNINTPMNYWAVESANLSELSEPLITMVKELTDQGAQVAKEHYGANGWVFHQCTDLWRVAAPMDGPTWGTFTVGGAWLSTHLWEHYLYSLDTEYLRSVYPVIKGAVTFFIDFLVEHPNGKWLVTNPSNSPENPPQAPGYRHFYDEVTGMYYFTTICAGSSIDMQVLTDLFGYYIEVAEMLNIDEEFAYKVAKARRRLVPPQIGTNGAMQEWTDDWKQAEDKHRHLSHMYGLYPGNIFSVRRTPQYTDALKAALEQRGDGGTGFSRAWKMALWARLYNGNRAYSIFKGYLKDQACHQLFAKCFETLQVDGSMGVTAGITEMLMQSHEGIIHLLPALPDEWSEGRFDGVCARGGFQLDMQWENKTITEVKILSKAGKTCRIDAGEKFTVSKAGKKVASKTYDDGSVSFQTKKGEIYTLERK